MVLSFLGGLERTRIMDLEKFQIWPKWTYCPRLATGTMDVRPWDLGPTWDRPMDNFPKFGLAWSGVDFGPKSCPRPLDMDWDRTWGLGQVRDSWSNVPSLFGSLSSPKMWTGTDFVRPWGTGAD